MSGDQLAYPARCLSPRIDSGLHRTHVASASHQNKPGSDQLLALQLDVGGFHHCVSSFNGAYHTVGFYQADRSHLVLVQELSLDSSTVVSAASNAALYGVISYSVAQRTHEFGIRMALGAERSSILRVVLADGLRLSLMGIAIGLATALGLTRLIESQLYGVTPTDPGTFTAVAAVLFAVALIASYLPARRATNVDPMQALRHE